MIASKLPKAFLRPSHARCFFRIVIHLCAWSSPFCGIDLPTELEMISAGKVLEEQTPLHGELHAIIISIASDGWSVSLMLLKLSFEINNLVAVLFQILDPLDR